MKGWTWRIPTRLKWMQVETGESVKFQIHKQLGVAVNKNKSLQSYEIGN